MKQTSLSAGKAVYQLLAQSEEVSARVTQIFPIVTDKARLPYISYRRTRFAQQQVTTGLGADAVEVSVRCYAAGYEESIDLAETVRRALDHRQLHTDEINLRSCSLTDSEEYYEADAFVQELIFTLRL